MDDGNIILRLSLSPVEKFFPHLTPRASSLLFFLSSPTDDPGSETLELQSETTWTKVRRGGDSGVSGAESLGLIVSGNVGDVSDLCLSTFWFYRCSVSPVCGRRFVQNRTEPNTPAADGFLWPTLQNCSIYPKIILYLDLKTCI